MLSLVSAACGSPASAPSPTSTSHASTTAPSRPPSTVGLGTSSTTTTEVRSATPGGGTGRDGVPAFSHVFLVMMENLGYSLALATPGFASLASRYASASDYYAVGHPSLPNYLAITSGGTWGVESDCISCYVDKANIAAQLSRAKISWGAYLEDVPSPCYLAPYFGDVLRGQAQPVALLRRHSVEPGAVRPPSSLRPVGSPPRRSGREGATLRVGHAEPV